MQRFWLFVTAVLSILGTAHPATAIPLTHDAERPLPLLRAMIVRNADPACAGHCSDWIALMGPIGPGSAPGFAKLLQGLGSRRLPVLINSPGGSVQDALAIGRLIRAQHLDVAVSKTELATCPADRAACGTMTPDGVLAGTIHTPFSVCASACTFILAAGTKRYVALRTAVGVHQFKMYATLVRTMRTFRVMKRRVGDHVETLSRTLIATRPISASRIVIKTQPAAYTEAQNFLARMGIAPNLIAIAETIPPQSIHWLTIAELESTRMDTEGKDIADVIGPQEESPVAPAPVPAPVAPALVPPPVPVASVSIDPVHRSTSKRTGDKARLTWSDLMGGQANEAEGRATWRLDAGHAMLRTSIDFGEVGSVDLSLEQPTDPAELGPIRMLVMLNPGPDSPLSKIDSIGLLRARQAIDTTAVELQGNVTKLTETTYWIDFDTEGAAGEQNARLLREAGLFEIQLMDSSLHPMQVVFDRGYVGTNLFLRWQRVPPPKPATG